MTRPARTFSLPSRNVWLIASSIRRGRSPPPKSCCTAKSAPMSEERFTPSRLLKERRTAEPSRQKSLPRSKSAPQDWSST